MAYRLLSERGEKIYYEVSVTMLDAETNRIAALYLDAGASVVYAMAVGADGDIDGRFDPDAIWR